jgi:ribosomal-protein-alanine N-acetyltransferase
MIKKICTDRCIMTSICEADFEEIVPLFTNKDVRRFLGGPLPSEWAFNKLNEALNKAEDIRFTVRLKNTNICIGLIFIAPHHNPSDMEISYMFFPEYWGMGYAFETVKTIIHFCNKTLNLNRVVSETQTANFSSCSLLEKLGYRLESKLERFGAEQSIYSLELTKE